MFWDSFYFLCVTSGKAPNKVAKELGIPSGSITAWKNGSVPRPETLQKIADYFETTVEKLLAKEQFVPSLSKDLGHGEIKTPADQKADGYSDAELLAAFQAADEATKEAIRLILKLK